MDIDQLYSYRRKGLLKCQAHPTKDLLIWNYDQKVQVQGCWDEILRTCRGLVTDSAGHIVARSFRKFFNIEENRHEPTDDFVVFDKIDGSLGLIFYHDGEWEVASRGSFISEQARRAKAMFERAVQKQTLDKTITYVVEIVYPENRIIVDYGDRDTLVFLSAFRPSGEELFLGRTDIEDVGFDYVQQYDCDDYKTLKNLNWTNSEGFVVRFSNGERVKIKFEQYLELHRISSNLSSSHIFEWFQDGSLSLDKRLRRTPDEFHEFVRTQWKQYEDRYNEIVKETTNRVKELCGLSAKDFAETVRDEKYRALLFAIRNGKMNIRKIVCRLVSYDSTIQISPQPKHHTALPAPDPEILLLVGPSGTGKSTWARRYVRGRKNSLIVSRDSLRQHIFGYDAGTLQDYYGDKHLHEREAWVTNSEFALVRSFLNSGCSVVIDDTNLVPSTIDRFLDHFKGYLIRFKVFDVDIQLTKKRNASREKSVPETILIKQWRQFEDLQQGYDFSPRVPSDDRIGQSEDLPDAFIFDMDGTLALHRGRHPFEWHRVAEDEINEPVRDICVSLQKIGYKIIICTARDRTAQEASQEWLAAHDIIYDEFCIRKENDKRPDVVVKEEMWRDLAQRYRLRALLDDRNRVVDHARQLGLSCFQVAEGDF